MQKLLHSAFIEADIAVPATEQSGAWSSNASLLNQRLKLTRTGQKADGKTWESSDLVRFRERVADGVPRKARQSLHCIMKRYPSLFNEVNFDETSITDDAAAIRASHGPLKRLASKAAPVSAMKRPARRA